jgi:hypothetical protein
MNTADRIDPGEQAAHTGLAAGREIFVRRRRRALLMRLA